MNCGQLQKRSNLFAANSDEWNHAAREMSNIERCRDAISRVAPHGDHLQQWLINEVSVHSHADREWVFGVLKGAIADQRPDISMAWLDYHLPTRYDGDRDGDDQSKEAA